MSKAAITIAFDLDALPDYTDAFLAQLWHVAQANPAPIADAAAGDIAERIGREIIKRWLAGTPADLWSHQGRHHAQCRLMDERSAAIDGCAA